MARIFVSVTSKIKGIGTYKWIGSIRSNGFYKPTGTPSKRAHCYLLYSYTKLTSINFPVRYTNSGKLVNWTPIKWFSVISCHTLTFRHTWPNYRQISSTFYVTLSGWYHWQLQNRLRLDKNRQLFYKSDGHKSWIIKPFTLWFLLKRN
jgi:hypothetical protein